MIDTYIITAPDVQKLKQKARKLKRNSELTHTQALDNVAKEIGLPNWKQVTLEHSDTLISEAALKTGVVLAYDAKDALEMPLNDTLLPRDERLELMCLPSLKAKIASMVDPDDPESRLFSETLSEVEFEEHLREVCSFVYFRVAASFDISTVKDLISFVQKSNFFLPEFIWHKNTIQSQREFIDLEYDFEADETAFNLADYFGLSIQEWTDMNVELIADTGNSGEMTYSYYFQIPESTPEEVLKRRNWSVGNTIADIPVWLVENRHHSLYEDLM